MRARAVVLFGLRIIVLTFILFGLYSVDFSGLSLSEEVRTAPAMLLLGLVLWVVDATLLWFGIRTFQRSKLVAQL